MLLFTMPKIFLPWKNFNIVKQQEFESSDKIEESDRRFSRASLYKEHKFKFLAEAITQSEKKELSVSQQFAILKSVQSKLSGKYSKKLETVLQKSPDVNFFENICQLTRKSNVIICQWCRFMLSNRFLYTNTFCRINVDHWLKQMYQSSV